MGPPKRTNAGNESGRLVETRIIGPMTPEGE